MPRKRTGYDAACYYDGKLLGRCTKADSDAYIRDCLDYGKNPEKTESGKYISAYECDPATVADEFLLAKASYYCLMHVYALGWFDGYFSSALNFCFCGIVMLPP